jgi:hypothetical protein
MNLTIHKVNLFKINAIYRISSNTNPLPIIIPLLIVASSKKFIENSNPLKIFYRKIVTPGSILEEIR